MALVGGYVTLSHCWGSADVIQLRAEKLEGFLVCLSYGQLPKTYRDAVEVTRRLGIRYLWIDSLCIVQDSPEDWQKEVRTMDIVYENAVCSIAATNSRDSHGSLFYDRVPLLVSQSSVLSSWNGQKPTYYKVTVDRVFDEEINLSPLNSRAWVVQERLLSPRILHFGPRQLFWECHELLACESSPDGLSGFCGGSNWLRKTHDPTDDLIVSPTGDQSAVSPYEPYQQWLAALEIYTRGGLTKEKDKLFAISALAKRTREIVKDDYLAGLWRQCLEYDIIWWVLDTRPDGQQPSTRAKTYRAPSWSWASIDIGVQIEFDRGQATTLLLQVLDAGTTPVTDDDTGEILDGFLSVQSAIQPITMDQNDANSMAGYQMYVSNPGGASGSPLEIDAYVHLDVYQEEERVRYWFLAHSLKDNADGDPNYGDGILLEKVGAEPGQ